MIRRHFIVRAFVPTIAAAAFAASAASAMPVRDVSCRTEMTTHRTVLPPDRVDAAAHAATVHGIGARLLAE